MVEKPHRHAANSSSSSSQRCIFQQESLLSRAQCQQCPADLCWRKEHLPQTLHGIGAELLLFLPGIQPRSRVGNIQRCIDIPSRHSFHQCPEKFPVFVKFLRPARRLRAHPRHFRRIMKPPTTPRQTILQQSSQLPLPHTPSQSGGMRIPTQREEIVFSTCSGAWVISRNRVLGEGSSIASAACWPSGCSSSPAASDLHGSLHPPVTVERERSSRIDPPSATVMAPCILIESQGYRLLVSPRKYGLSSRSPSPWFGIVQARLCPSPLS